MRQLLLRSAVATALVLSLTGCAFHGLYSAPLPGGADLGSHPYRVLIDFTDVLDLVPQSSVKVNDVTVGKVESIRLIDWHAQVQIALNGNVVVTGPGPGSGAPLTLITDTMRINTPTEFIETDSPVQLRWSGRQLLSRGMKADLKAGTLRLESEVHGEFSPR